MKRALIFAAVACAVVVQPARAEPDQTWTALNVSGPVARDSRWLVWFDGHARLTEGDGADISILRPGVGYRMNPKLDVWVGYARVTRHEAASDIVEHRLWQQATYPIGEAAGGRITARTRLEQRFRDQGDTGWRLRQQVRYARPIATSVSAIAWNETFVGLNETDWGQGKGLNLSRTFLGLGWSPTPRYRVEAGYLNQHTLNRRVGGRDASDHNVMATLNVLL